MKGTSPATTLASVSTPDNSLLGVDHGAWDSSKLGPVDKWPTTLKAFAQTILAISYPAALLWSKDHVLLHNEAWREAGSLTDQGQPQRESLSTELLDVLEEVTKDGLPKGFPSAKLLSQDAAKADEYGSTAFLTPLSADETESCIMVQILPGSKPQQNSASSRDGNATKDHALTTDSKGIDEIPLNEHPYFKKFAEMLPSGLAILDHEAQAVFVNQHFYELTTTTSGDEKFTSWPQSIHDDDYDRVMSAYREAFKNQTQLRTEFRARGEPHPWRLLLLTPLGDDNLRQVSGNKFGGFICSIVDISSEKQAEINERKAAKQARERKEQQERFIDMISHEIRNPLSAVLHSAEDISEAITKGGNEIDVDMIREAVETIHLCVSHQKNIVDDVLSFSKLDASLLSLVPRPSQPSRQLANTLKMFQHEFRKEKLQFSFNVDDTYDKVNVSWVLADVARVSQVLINLITNAIKFTHNVDRDKQIQCSVGASLERPHSYPPDVVFYRSDNIAHRMDATNSKDWGDGEALYVMVAVRDTGIGISSEGQKRLFERFQQATPKTEEVYGGSGLGLNISRKICHLHGGEIGVSSREGQGSTFGFFFKVKRTDQHPDAKEEDEAEKQEEHEMRGKIRALGKQNPNHLDTAEPFEYSKPERKSQDQREESDQSAGKMKHNYDDAPPGEGDINVHDESTGQSRPQAPRHISEDVNTPDSEATNTKRPISSLNREPSRRAHVLLVEDNIVNQKIIFRKLETKGFNITTANNGQEAVEAVKAAPKLNTGDKKAFDIILMDQEMPIMDGNAATKAIRQLEQEGQTDRVPILGVTANARGAQQDEMLKNGMDDVISKPYKIDELVSLLTKLTVP
ncbi:Histidine protein kinase NIK1 [Fulvia fulva]|uniref:histidine kinase n=1 Tax=Passalora fulva TaxID=5499 RepID=A0A9Q8P5Y7_PASFU|nr:Histidine protein kinase NIK1 [Fulvia fulva]KAK4631319.1 Histidine protein kinase NIK1 [Fulvia fulva]KAK4633744.1 Histidine protein kinase NIK1 [Fulvia fulva]UJO14488.1 Histidine protein kinase NIK1 [Fulvia fulva]WPV11060.1 Histidine protein kinase NIK1 [Fulvia fulva]WPV26235.1 Histidine protein kinase NIK1 [Fulvia fulva]